MWVHNLRKRGTELIWALGRNTQCWRFTKHQRTECLHLVTLLQLLCSQEVTALLVTAGRLCPGLL